MLQNKLMYTHINSEGHKHPKERKGNEKTF